MNDDWKADEPSRPEWRAPEEPQLETDAYHIWKPRPLLRSVHWKPIPPVAREDMAGAYDVFIDQRVFRAMHQHVWNAAADQAPFGFLAGDLCEDPDTGRRYVIVSAAIPARPPLDEKGPTQMPSEALAAMRLEVERRRGVLAGWYHRHTAGEVRLTAVDMVTHEEHFPEPWQVAMLFVTDHQSPIGGCFRRTLAGFDGSTPLPFFEMVSNESLLAKGKRRSHVDWENLETVDSIQSEPPPRPVSPPRTPEPEPEPALEPAPDPAHVQPPGEPAVVVEGEADSEAPEVDEGTSRPEEEELVGLLPVLEDDVPAVEDDALEAEAEAPGAEPELPAGPDRDIDALEQPDDSLSAIARDLDAAQAVIELAERELGIAGDDREDAGSEDATPVADETAAGPDVVSTEDEARREGAEGLPEPGWDEEEGAAGPPVPLDDVDLDSFVVQVESADVEGQVGEAEEPARLEPDWDVADDRELVLEPIAAPLPTEQAEVAELEPGPAPGEQPPVVTPPVKKRRGRRIGLLIAALIAAVAVTAILVTVLRTASEDGAAGPEGPAGAVVVPDAGSAGPDEGGPPIEAEAGPAAEAAALSEAVTESRMEELGESLLESISRYYGLAVAAEDGRATCAELQEAYVEVEDDWIAYNVEGKARYRGRLPDRLAVRDERLYDGVRDVETEFGRSGCERP